MNVQHRPFVASRVGVRLLEYADVVAHMLERRLADDDVRLGGNELTDHLHVAATKLQIRIFRGQPRPVRVCVAVDADVTRHTATGPRLQARALASGSPAGIENAQRTDLP